jgi:hypothetical protein
MAVLAGLGSLTGIAVIFDTGIPFMLPCMLPRQTQERWSQ